VLADDLAGVFVEDVAVAVIAAVEGVERDQAFDEEVG
jgi:hypothetical protein